MFQFLPLQPLELWAGIECTVNRVREHYFDQLVWNGHTKRLDDLTRFAELGIRTLRYPILWESTAPRGLDLADWRWADERLNRLRELGIRPIVGLLHHGSGPRDTNLADPTFPEKFAAYARAVAERYPWLDAYTPINEPLTTARFSGLYGVWYPHAQQDRVFMRMMLNQCRATRLAMCEIRRVNPNAQLVQTEDLAYISSSPELAYQAEFENERRWLTYDLLGGCINEAHPMWGYLEWLEFSEAELNEFLDEPCPPQILGCNYYLTGERFLDADWERYPEETHGSNGRDKYADVEAVRVLPQGTAGLAALLQQAWARYHLPLAITESHLGCTRDEQLRWLNEAWQTAHTLRDKGIDLRAVTAWALLGTFNWDNLVTRDDDHYEPGLYDVRAPAPRPTALAQMAKQFATDKPYDHPVLDVPGWWHRPARLLYSNPSTMNEKRFPTARPLLITNGTGSLAAAFARLSQERGLAYRLLPSKALNVADAASVERAIKQSKPWAILNAAEYRQLEEAEWNVEQRIRENIVGPSVLAKACAQHQLAFVTFSTDLVFDGEQDRPYVESDATKPLNEYGRNQAEGERRVLELDPNALIIRTSALFGPWDDSNFVAAVLDVLRLGGDVVVAQDRILSPTYLPDLVQTTLDLLIDGESGIWHLANAGAISWADLARNVAQRARFDSERITGKSRNEFSRAPLPRYTALGSERAWLMPTLESALERYFAECESAKFQTPLEARAEEVLEYSPAFL